MEHILVGILLIHPAFSSSMSLIVLLIRFVSNSYCWGNWDDPGNFWSRLLHLFMDGLHSLGLLHIFRMKTLAFLLTFRSIFHVCHQVQEIVSIFCLSLLVVLFTKPPFLLYLLTLQFTVM